MANSYVEKNVFNKLNSINVNEHTEKKCNLTYLSWSWAWAEVKKQFPEATYTVYENKDGFNYFTDGKTCWTKVGLTIEGIEHIEYLPVMDFKNKSIPADKVTSMDVNKAIQRGLTKACARHGLGLYIYAGEDLPEPSDGVTEEAPVQSVPQRQPVPQQPVSQPVQLQATAPVPPKPVQTAPPAPPKSAPQPVQNQNTATTSTAPKKWASVKKF